MKSILLIAGLIYSTFAWSQLTAIAKVHAYQQTTSAGVNQRPDAVEEGNDQAVPPPPSVAKMNYIIYAEQRSNTQIVFHSVWINGKAFSMSADRVEHTPVELTSEEQKDPTILVPATKNKVWALAAGAPLAKPAPSKILRQLIQSSEMVVVYRWKGRLYYSAVKKIKQLGAVSGV